MCKLRVIFFVFLTMFLMVYVLYFGNFGILVFCAAVRALWRSRCMCVFFHQLHQVVLAEFISDLRSGDVAQLVVMMCAYHDLNKPKPF